MQWGEIRQQYPDQWLLVEAVDAHTEGDQRILDDLSILQSFADIKEAMTHYGAVRRKSPFRELYILHTSREIIEISETRLLNLRMIS